VREGGDRHGDRPAGRVRPDVVHRGVRRHRESVERQGRALPGEARDDRPEGEGSGRDRRGHHCGRAGDRRARQPRRRAARGDRQSVTAGTMNVAGRRSRSSPILTYNGVRGGRLLARALSGSFLVPARARCAWPSVQKLAEVCIRRPVFASMIVLALVVVGGASYFRLGVDRFPSVDLPTVTVRTELPGASTEEMETQVSQKIEEVVNTIQG